ncbi:hypothetical protein JTE90_017111 [Oedothorax gibbosus]|uniref:Chitin-binding type-2 domain-containing protein n=1 Tax=Oedothorax gibbosus TaxID=931172 RepID=A0AAV6UFX3_9ARAC|nr:hypothetical protein JTE90_017111 [Oedothorax gibbosus]
MKNKSILTIFVFFIVILQTCHDTQARQDLRAAAWLDDEDGDNIPGKMWEDYPAHATVPKDTSFRCKDYDYAGYFGDTEAGCQAYHVCFPDGRNASFLCVNGTVFHQRYYVCDWWFHYDCLGSPNDYHLNLYRKVPLPVLPPAPRRPFPGPAKSPQPLAPRLPPPKRDNDRDGPNSDRDKKKKEDLSNPRTKPDNRYNNPNSENKYKNPNSENKYKNPNSGNKYRNPLVDPKSEDKCNCQCP